MRGGREGGFTYNLVGIIKQFIRKGCVGVFMIKDRAVILNKIHTTKRLSSMLSKENLKREENIVY